MAGRHSRAQEMLGASEEVLNEGARKGQASPWQPAGWPQSCKAAACCNPRQNCTIPDPMSPDIEATVLMSSIKSSLAPPRARHIQIKITGAREQLRRVYEGVADPGAPPWAGLPANIVLFQLILVRPPGSRLVRFSSVDVDAAHPHACSATMVRKLVYAIERRCGLVGPVQVFISSACPSRRR